jgi:hypothetical protein
MEALTLRDLAREFAKGNLDRESYRRNRATLIDGILAGTIQVEPIDFAAPVAAKSPMDNTSPGKRKRQADANAVELDELDVFDITQVVPASGDITPPRPQPPAASAPAQNLNHQPHSNLPLVIVGIIAIVAVLGLVFALVSRKNEAPAAADRRAETPAVTADNTGGTTPEPVAATATPAPGGANTATDALVEFLQVKNWSDESLDQFQARWQSLPQADRDAAAGSGELLQVANAAYRKLLEIRALSHVSEPATTQQKEGKLLAFVAGLGITDSRLTPQAANGTATSN